MPKDDLSEEDKALFRAYVRDMPPIDKTSTTSTRPNKEYFLSDYISTPVFSETLLTYCNPNLPAKQFQALKNGKISWESRLDLHGLNTEQARLALCRFIQEQSQNKARCLLIVHGKGSHHGEPPLIKNLVNRWLPQIDEILGFHSAQPKDGGRGAVYVLLKRQYGL